MLKEKDIRDRTKLVCVTDPIAMELPQGHHPLDTEEDLDLMKRSSYLYQEYVFLF